MTSRSVCPIAFLTVLLGAGGRAFGGYYGDSMTTSVVMTTTQTVYLSTLEHPNGSESILTLSIDFLNFQGLAVSRTVTGNALVNMALDGSQTGTIEVLSSSINLANGTSAFLVGSLLEGTISTTNISGAFTLGSTSVENRDLTINSGSPGGLQLNSGTLQMTITGGMLAGTVTGLLGSNGGTIDLSANPISFLFSDLGTTVLDATTDIDSSGLDEDGAELNLPLNVATSISEAFGLAFPTPVSAQGVLYLGSVIIPEFS